MLCTYGIKVRLLPVKENSWCDSLNGRVVEVYGFEKSSTRYLQAQNMRELIDSMDKLYVKKDSSALFVFPVLPENVEIIE